MDLITGSCGIVGIHLLHAYASAGERVRALHRKGSDREIVRLVFRHYSDRADELLDRIEWVEGDLHDIGSLTDAMAGIRRVHHAAAMVSFDPRDARRLFKVNAEGTANVVNAALIQGVQRICHVSSTAAIGQADPSIERHEGLPWQADRNTSPYAASKYAAEMEVYRGIAEGLDAVIVNPCVIIGPGAAGRSTMTLIGKLHEGTRFFPPGSNAIVDARDVAACMRQLIDVAPTGERYLLVGENITYRDLFTKAAEAFGNTPPSIALSPTLLELGWRAERVRTALFGGKPFVTRATVHSSIIHRKYSNGKVKKILRYEFRDADEALRNVAAYLKGSKERKGTALSEPV